MKNQKKDLDCYRVCQKRKKREKFLFYFLEFIAVAEILFFVYISMET